MNPILYFTFEFLLILLLAFSIVGALIGLLAVFDGGVAEGWFVILGSIVGAIIAVFLMNTLFHSQESNHRDTLTKALAAEGWTNPRFYDLDVDNNEVSFDCGAPSYRVYTVKLVKIDGKYRTVLPRQESVGGGYSLFGRKDLALTCP